MKDIEYVISQANLGYDESQLQLARYYFEEKSMQMHLYGIIKL